MSQAGLVVIAMAGLWIAYLVPHRLRYHQQLLESRTEDRFSAQLRVLRVAQARAGAPTGTAPAPAQVLLHRPTTRARGDGAMERPHGSRDRVAADAVRREAAEAARRVADARARRAAAHRRAVLTLVLAVATVAGWAAVGQGLAGVLAGVAPTVALLGVLALGRRAVVAARRREAHGPATAAVAPSGPRSARTSVTRRVVERTSVRTVRPARRGAHGPASAVVGRAVHPSEDATEVLVRVTDERRVARTSALAPAAEVAEADREPRTAPAVARRSVTERVDVPAPREDASRTTGSWAPVPVPPPAYTLKPEARRAEPAPLVLDERTAGAADVTGDRGDLVVSTAEIEAVLAAGAPGVPVAEPVREPVPAATAVAPLDLDAVLARRRASGE